MTFGSEFNPDSIVDRQQETLSSPAAAAVFTFLYDETRISAKGYLHGVHPRFRRTEQNQKKTPVLSYVYTIQLGPDEPVPHHTSHDSEVSRSCRCRSKIHS